MSILGLHLIEDGVHQTLFVVDALLKGNHGLRPGNPVDVVYLEDDVLGVVGILGPDLAKDIELARGNMGNGHIGNLVQPFKDKFGLVGLFQKDAHIGYKGIAQFNIVQGKGGTTDDPGLFHFLYPDMDRTGRNQQFFCNICKRGSGIVNQHIQNLVVDFVQFDFIHNY
jgi:hypothetical protein